jgi:hypothetical protein
MKVDPASLATGYRTSEVVGATVVNEANETVGMIDDLIVTPTERVPFAVPSVGGFLGMGTKYVVVPYSALRVGDKNMVLPGATKESLKNLPEFKYSTTPRTIVGSWTVLAPQAAAHHRHGQHDRY